jgi:alkanesulfonate monooxygenase SsuD/methylene tetrahydromethanopterin reductase-like flavin-dependent oxidoreductase (luciferase family)
VDFGTFHLHSAPADRPPRTIVHEHFRQMLAAERLGFAEAWIAEHNAREYGFIGNSVIVAAALAAATTRIRIGTAVTRLPVHNPLHLAEDLAYADILSGGRVDWGVGKGYDEHEFATYGVNFAEREERWEETFNAVRQMWSTGRTAYNGEFYRLGDGQLIPLPQQVPLPTYIMVSGSERSVTWAAERLLPIVIGSGPGWDDMRARLELYAETAERHGHSRADIEATIAQTWQLRPVHVAPTYEQAVSEFERGLMWYMRSLDNRAMFGFSHESKDYDYFLTHGAVLVGPPAKLADDLAEYNERTGINKVICWFNVGGQPTAQTLGAMELFADGVAALLADVETDGLRRPATPAL